MSTNNPAADRILDALLLRAEQEATQRTLNPAIRLNDPYLLRLRLDHYQSVLIGYTGNRDLIREERQGLTYIRAAMRRLDARLHPSVAKRLRYWPPIDRLVNWTRGRLAIVNSYDRRLQEAIKKTTQQQNVQRLTEEMKKSGFTVSLEGPLKRAISHNMPSFSLPYAAAGDGKTDYTLFFRKLPGTDTYYFEKFDAAAKPTVAEILRSKSQPIRHQFSPLDEIPFTAREAASMVHHIPVAKIIQGKEQWAITGLDGKRNWVQFDFEKVLANYPIKEMQDPARRNALLAALRSGAIAKITFTDQFDPHQKLTMQIDPKAQSFLFKDQNGSLIDAAFIDITKFDKMMVLKQSKTAGLVRQLHPRHHA